MDAHTAAVAVLRTGWRGNRESYGIFTVPRSSLVSCIYMSFMPTEDAMPGCQCPLKKVSQMLISKVISATGGTLSFA